MKDRLKFEKRSYKAHKDWLLSQFPTYLQQLERLNFLIGRETTQSYNYWIRSVGYKFLNPFLKTNHSWLTIGDCYGTDAEYLARTNSNVVASDISDTFLAIAKEIGFIKEYARQNAEKMDYEDNSFDYVLCNDTFHHFPRPYIALYEMLRVARKAVILKEPIDPLSRMPLLLFACNVLDRKNPLKSGKIWKNRFSFEPVGNYVFKVSPREIEKIAMAANLPYIAYYYYNLPYDESLSEERMDHKSRKFARYLLRLRLRNFLCKLHLIPYSFVCPVLFKEEPTPELLNEMDSFGYSCLKLPKNPYI